MRTDCSPETGCHRCGGKCSGRWRAHCSKECRDAQIDNHLWNAARHRTILNAGGYLHTRCAQCGDTASAEREVHHIVPLKGSYGNVSCEHHQTNLRVLCKSCHTKVHKDINAYTLEVDEQTPRAKKIIRLRKLYGISVYRPVTGSHKPWP